jgi:hypothetical protein
MTEIEVRDVATRARAAPYVERDGVEFKGGVEGG